MNLIKIKVEDEPECLTLLREDNRTYTDLKNDCLANTRAILYRDQGGICAYCEQKFRSEVFIEHYITQHADPSKDLDFNNFLGVCSGKEYFDPKKTPKHIPHCGNNRGSEKLNIDPRNSEHISQIFYDNDSSIRSHIPSHDNEIQNLLNLNFDILKERRTNAYKRNYINLIKVQKKHNWSKEITLDRALTVLNSKKSEFNGYLKYRYFEQKNST